MFTFISSDVTVTSQQHAAAADAAMLAAYTWRLNNSTVGSSPYARRGDACWLSMRRAAAAAAAAHSASSSSDFSPLNVTSSSNDALTSSGVRSKSLGRESTTTLKTWLLEHIKNPYPSKGEKIMLAVMTRMTLTQVSTWFANARRRLKKEYRVRWLDDDDDNDDDDFDDDDNDTDERDGDDSELQRQTTHLKTSDDASVYHEPDFIVSAGNHDSSLPSSAAATPDDCSSHSSDTASGDDQQQDQPVNMTCRRRSATVHTGLITNVILPTLQHDSGLRPASVSPRAVEAPRIWSVVELIQSNKDDNVKPQSTKLL